ncbi:MAG: hypothetical protein U9O78_01680, partial [Patescibacteria group bacterium]|nr:hypothetical protein [Patescibacteria group bacterium]
MKFYIKKDLSELKKMKLRQRMLKDSGRKASDLFEICVFDPEKVGKKNCENLIGGIEVPVGVAGPMDKLEFYDLGVEQGGEGDYQKSFDLIKEKRKLLKQIIFPLATTEGALVASVSRGIKVLNSSGAARCIVVKKGMTRAPVFKLRSGLEAKKFCYWLKMNFSEIKKIAEKTSGHLSLVDLKTWSQGPSVFARFSFDTDQAMGMNMVTIALKQVWQELVSAHPNVELISISGNMCVDKKASALNQLLGRGYQVKAEVVISEDMVKELLGVSVEKLALIHYWKNVVGTNLAGSNSQNMHVANMVAAMFLATGQDIAHVVEGSQANTIMEKRKDGLYV